MGTLRSVWTVGLLLACAGLAYQGWRNSRIPHPVDARAEAIACEEHHVCRNGTARWSAIDASPFARTYVVDVGTGPVSIECRWSMVLLGDVGCHATREEIPVAVDHDPERLPHEIQRGG